MDVNIVSVQNLGGGVLMIEGNFRSTDAPHAFYEREVGIMAHIDSNPDQLYSVANVFADPPNYIDPAAPTVRAYKIKLIVDRVDPADITVSISPTEAVSGVNVGSGDDGPGVYQSTAGNILKFKRIVGGDGIEVTQDNPDDSLATEITIGARQLHTNVDLYVPLTYPGITDPTILFATVQDAHDYLLQFHIPADKTATIHVYSGHFANSVPIQFTHPDAVRINVTGLDISSRTFRGGTNMVRGGSLPNLTYALNLNDASGIAVGDLIFVHNAPQAQLEGVGRVTSIAGTTITVSMHFAMDASVIPPSSIAPLGSTRVIVFPTQFTSTMTGGVPVFNCPNGIGRIKNFAICGPAYTPPAAPVGQAIGILGGNTNSVLDRIIFARFSIGIGISAPTNFWPMLSGNDCSVAIEVGPAGTAFLMGQTVFGGNTYLRFVWSGNIVYGLWVAGGTRVTTAPSGAGCNTWCTSNATGIRSDTRAWVGMGDGQAGNAFGFVVGYNNEGCVAALMGIIQSALSTISLIQLNVNHDFVASAGAQIGVTHNSSMPPAGNFDPPNHVLGSDGAYIAVA